MSAPLRFSRYRDMAAEIADRLAAGRSAADALAPWDEEVIVPSSGVRHAVVSALLERIPAGIAGLRLHTLDQLALRLVNDAGEFLRTPTDAERRLTMRTAIHTVTHPMMEGRGVAAMLERSYRDVRDSGLTIADVNARLRTSRGLRNVERTRAIVRAWTEYERLIALLGAVDGADVLTRATQLATAARPQLLAGFYDMTGAQRRLVEALFKSGRIGASWIPADLPFAEPLVWSLREKGARPVILSREDGEESSPSPRATAGSVAVFAAQDDKVGASLTALPTVHDELRHACQAISALLAEGCTSIGIVARSLEAHDARLLQRFAEESGFSITIAPPLPLIAHRIGRGAVTLLRLRERGFPRADVLELVRDGLRTRAHLDVDSVDAATRRARIAGGATADLQPFRNRSRAVDAYLALVAELEELTVDLDLVGRLGSMFRIDTDLDARAAEALDGVAALFRRADVWNRGLDVKAVIDAIEQIELSAGSADGVWAGEMLRFRGRTFEHLFVVRMQDDVFPQRRNEDPLLPDSDRRILGLREIGDGSDEEQYLLRLLYDGATSEVHFSYSAGDGFGRVLRPSRFVRAMPPREVLQRRAAVRRTAPSRSLQLLARAGTRSPFDGYLSVDVSSRVASVSPTQLEDFGECPQKFLLKHILGVEDLEHPERELQIDIREKGTLDHRVLERFYRHLGTGNLQADISRAAALLPLLPLDLSQRLDSLIDEAFDAHEREVPPYNRTVRGMERRATKRNLRDFLASDLADLDENGLVPRHFEYRFGRKHREEADHPEPFVLDAAGVPLRIEGTIDRIDVAGAKHRIVDYKSGKAMRHSGLAGKIERGVRLQLALYAMAVSDFFDVDPNDVSGTIKPLNVDGLKAEKFAFELGEKRDALLQTLNLFMTAILRGVFPAFPSEGDVDSCKYCPVNHSCRTKHDPDERYAVQQEKDPRTLLTNAFAEDVLGGGRA